MATFENKTKKYEFFITFKHVEPRKATKPTVKFEFFMTYWNVTKSGELQCNYNAYSHFLVGLTITQIWQFCLQILKFKTRQNI